MDKPLEFSIKMEPDNAESPVEQMKTLLKTFQDALPQHLQLQLLVAQITRAKFNALVKEGFTEQQALFLCKDK